MSDSTAPSAPVRQLRLVVEAEDFDQALIFYRDVLGLPEQVAYEGEGDARVATLQAGIATLELSNPAQFRMIDAVEADGRPSQRIRIAFEVEDTARTSQRLVDSGATLTAAARQTPWRSVNARLRAPADLDITLFQELEPLEQRSQRPEFDTPTGRSNSTAE